MRYLCILVIVCCTQISWAQDRTKYVYEYAQIAVEEMEFSGIPASITLAQGILESGNGNSELAKKSNNHFGIKCHKGWNGESVSYDDDAKGECFRKYKDPAESYRDHTLFLTTRSRYKDLFTYSKYDYKAWAKGLKKAGYATNPAYANLLIRIIEEEELYSYDYMRPNEVGPYITAHKQGRAPKTVTTSRPPESVSKPPKTKPSKVKLPENPTNTGELSRNVFTQNNSKAVWARPGDSPEQLSVMYNVPLKKLRKYNEWDKYLNEFEAGMKVYLQPKRSKSQDRASLYHKARDGETMYQIAQLYGIKTDKLYKLNQLSEGQQPAPNEIIHLRKKRKTAPKTFTYSKEFRVEQPAPPPVKKPSPPSVEVKEVVKPPPPPSKKKATPPPPPPAMEQNETPPVQTLPPPVKAVEAPPVEANPPGNKAVIYDPPPPVNQAPPRVYTPPANVPESDPGNTTVIQTNPVGTSSGTSTSAGTTHKVVSGDTLYGLSKKYGVSVDQIKQLNNLTGNTIKVGQVLRIRQ